MPGPGRRYLFRTDGSHQFLSSSSSVPSMGANFFAALLNPQLGPLLQPGSAQPEVDPPMCVDCCQLSDDQSLAYQAFCSWEFVSSAIKPGISSISEIGSSDTSSGSRKGVPSPAS